MFTEALAPFFKTDEFGDVGSFAVGTSTATSVNGIFENAAANTLQIEGQTPTFLCAAADLPANFRTGTATIRSTPYAIVGVDEDGQGVVRLKLQES